MTAFGQPCPHCAVRPDVGCRHRPADPTYKPPLPTEDAPKRDHAGQGYNFRVNARKLISGGGRYNKGSKK